jgi:hypothetical protein
VSAEEFLGVWLVLTIVAGYLRCRTTDPYSGACSRPTCRRVMFTRLIRKVGASCCELSNTERFHLVGGANLYGRALQR